MKYLHIQESCDAVLMAWPIMDAENKKCNDPFSSNCCVEGIPINQLSFVHDLIEFTKNEISTNERNVGNEIFERKTRLNFKTSKCKIMPMNRKRDIEFHLNDQKMEVVDDHVYLGTIVSRNGQRIKDMQDRIKKTKSVANEIVQICKETELSKIRLRYVKLLTSSCLDSKVKYGSALWSLACKKSVVDIDKIKPKLLKGVMQLPSSTPSDAVLYEFGVNDLSIDILSEKIILAAEVLNKDDNRICKQLLKALLEKKVDGFCTEVYEACDVLDTSLEELDGNQDIRKTIKCKALALQQTELFKRVIVCSKMDKILLSGFQFDGQIKKYLLELDFEEARAVFMIRYRMLPTKNNYPGRWHGSRCNICGLEDTDAHVFSCPAYCDFISEDIWYEMFWDDRILNDMVKLQKAATLLLGIIERMENIQNMVGQ